MPKETVDMVIEGMTCDHCAVRIERALAKRADLHEGREDTVVLRRVGTGDRMTPKGQLYASVAGTVAVAVCCFTPVMVIALGAIGLAAWTPYLDRVLFPALTVLIVIAGISYRRYVRASKHTITAPK